MSEKKHHFLVTGEIVFVMKDSEQINALRINAIVNGNTNQIPVRTISKAQQALQLQFYQRMDDPEVDIRDVVITNITYLGHMTEEEFHLPPEKSSAKGKSTEDDAVASAVFGDALH